MEYPKSWSFEVIVKGSKTNLDVNLLENAQNLFLIEILTDNQNTLLQHQISHSLSRHNFAKSGIFTKKTLFRIFPDKLMEGSSINLQKFCLSTYGLFEIYMH